MIKVDALLEKVMETETQLSVAALNLRPYQLRMVLDLLGVVTQTLPLAMQAKDALAGTPPPTPVVRDMSAETTIIGKHILHLTGLDVELLSGKFGGAYAWSSITRHSIDCNNDIRRRHYRSHGLKVIQLD